MTATSCRRCGHAALDADAFCEACGAPLVTATAHQAAQAEGRAAAASDIGLRRERNEDAFALASSTERTILVVCDGVASTPSAGSAAALAARTVLATLTAGHASQLRQPAEVAQLLREALNVAHRVVSDLAVSDPLVATADRDETRDGAPSTTCVVAVALGTSVLVASLGDSRAYWIPQSGEERLLTTDDSEPEALLALQAAVPGRATPLTRHLTRWIGADDSGAPPRVHLLEVDGPGVLLLCTDGLWQYFDRPGALAALVASDSTAPSSALDVAHRLVAAALSAGGGDNVTAAVLPLDPGPTVAVGE